MRAKIHWLYRLTGMFVCFFVFLRAEDLPACSCAPPPPPLQELLDVDLVFSGTVQEIQILKDDHFWAGDILAARFQVEVLWKGRAGSEITVFTAAFSDACGFPFQLGQSYFVYAQMQEGRFTTHSCSRTKLFSQAAEDVQELSREAGSSSHFITSRNRAGRPGIHLAGVANQSVTIETSIDLTTWAVAEEFPSAPSYIDLEDEASADEVASRYYRARIEPRYPEGVYGQVLAYPGACLIDPEHPGECLNLPFPGAGSYDVRAYSDEPDNGFSNPIVTSFNSTNDGETEALPLSAAYAAGLNSQRVSELLWKELLGGGVFLSHAVEVLVQMPDRLWILHDPLTLRSFVISRENWNEAKLDRLVLSASGWFQAPLSPGRYCLWEHAICVAQVEIEAGKWNFALLGQFLP